MAARKRPAAAGQKARRAKVNKNKKNRSGRSGWTAWKAKDSRASESQTSVKPSPGKATAEIACGPDAASAGLAKSTADVACGPDAPDHPDAPRTPPRGAPRPVKRTVGTETPWKYHYCTCKCTCPLKLGYRKLDLSDDPEPLDWRPMVPIGTQPARVPRSFAR